MLSHLTRPRAAARAAGLASLTTLLIAAAPAGATIGNFDGADGNQACVPAGAVDWACVTPSSAILRTPDASGPSDTGLTGKENEPDGWTISSGSVQDKSDIQNIWRTSTESTPGSSFLNLALKRAADGGNAHFAFELNQKRTTWVNGSGTTVHCRTDGDVLVSYDIETSVSVELRKWNGSGGPAGCPDGATGTWATGLGAPATFEGALNGGAITNALSGYPAGTTFETGTFGEAALNMSSIAQQLDFSKTCEFFTSLQARSRASSSESADLKDSAGSTDVTIAACEPPPGGGGGGGGTPPAPPVMSGSDTACLPSGDVTLSGSADPGVQVLVREDGTTTRAIADADPTTGAWSVTFPAPDGSHSYTAIAVDADGPSGASSAVTVLVDGSADAATTITSPADGASLPAGVVTVTGTAEPGATVTLLDGATTVGTTTADDTGAWSITAPAAETHAFSAGATDGCNASPATARSATTTSGSTAGGGTPTTPVGAVAGVTATGGTTPKPTAAVLDLSIGGIPSGCSAKAFTTFVTDRKKQLKQVVFRIDGRVVATVKKRDKLLRFVVRIDPRKFKLGNRKLTATLVYKAKGKRATVVNRRFRVCDACKSRRGFRIRLPRPGGEKLRSAQVFVNGKRVKVLKGKRLTATVKLVGLPKGTYKVKIRVVTRSGRIATSTRTYRTCVPKTKTAVKS